MDNQPVCRGMAPMTRQSFQSPLARALGRGAAKSGVHHWWAERVTAVALVPLCLWFAASIIAYASSDYASFIASLADCELPPELRIHLFLLPLQAKAALVKELDRKLKLWQSL